MGKALRDGYRDKVFLITKIDGRSKKEAAKQLDESLEAVRTFQPMTNEQVQALLAKTTDSGAKGKFEPFKTSSIFDGTAQYPVWLGEEPQRLQQLMSAQPS